MRAAAERGARGDGQLDRCSAGGRCSATPTASRELRADRSLLPNAVEELLRFDTPLQMFERWVLEPFEIHGVQIPRGAELGLLFGSANRDPSVFERTRTSST